MRELQQNEVALINGGCDVCGHNKEAKEASQALVISAAATGLGGGIGFVLFESNPVMGFLLGMISGFSTFLYLDGPKKFEPLFNRNTPTAA